jgi:hypothetical protein
MVPVDPDLTAEDASPEAQAQRSALRRVVEMLGTVLSPTDWLILWDWAHGVSDQQQADRDGISRTAARQRRLDLIARSRVYLEAFGVTAMTDVCAD